MATLASYKKAYTENLEQVLRDAHAFFPVPHDVVAARLALAEQVSTFPQLLTLASFRFPQLNGAYKGVAPLTPPASAHLGPRVDEAPVEWHAIYGQGEKGAAAFVVGVLRLDVAYHAPLYIINGGVGVEGVWYPFPFNAGTGTWSTPAAGSHRFVTTTNAGNPPQGFKSFSATFDATADALKYTVAYVTDEEKSLELAVAAKSLADATAVFQGKGGCVPVCFGGVGTSYISYPLLNHATVDVSIDGSLSEEHRVTAWFDHQWLAAGIPKPPSTRYLYGLLQGGRKPAPMRWIWFSMQVPGEQYGGSFAVTGADLPLQVGTRLLGTVNRFQLPEHPAARDLNVLAAGTVKKITSFAAPGGGGSYDFPTQLEITIGAKTFALAAALPGEVVFMPSGLFNWEGPATASGAAAGTGFIECSNFLSDEDSVELAFANAGFAPLPPPIARGLLPHPTSTRARWWFGAWLAGTLVLLVASLVLGHRGRKPWSAGAAVFAAGASIAVVAPAF